jgi:hypothetical protein
MYLFTPCSRVTLEKLTSSQLVKKLLAFYGTPRFITAFMTALPLFQILKTYYFSTQLPCFSKHCA